MTPADRNYLIDIGLIITFLLSVVTGILKFPSLLQALGLSYKSLPMAQISLIHGWSSIAMILFVLLHLIFHRNFFSVMTKKYFKGKKSLAYRSGHL